MTRKIHILSGKIDEVEHYISEAYAPVDVEGIGEHSEYGVIGNVTHFDGVLVEWSKTIGSYQIKPKVEFNSVIFNMMIKGNARYAINGREIELPEGSAISYRHPDRVEIINESVHATVAISNELLQRRLAILLDGEVPRCVDFMDHPVTRASSISSFSAFICALEQSPTMALASFMRPRSESIADLIVDGFLMSFPHNCTDKLTEPAPAIAPKQVKRALEYIHANPRAHVSPEFLAGLSSVSLRSLQYTFKATMGCTISEYQQLLRIRSASDDIKSNPDVPLKIIAERWGFGSLTNFGQVFKKIYGMPPSQLRRDGS